MRNTLIVMSVAAIVAAVCLVVYGAGLSWKQVLISSAAFCLLCVANQCRAEAFPKRKHQRLNISIVFTNVRQALLDCEVPDENVPMENEIVAVGLCWIEEDLFYISNDSRTYFTSEPTLHIDLKTPARPVHASAHKEYRPPHRIFLRRGLDGYGFFLVTSDEQRNVERYGRTPDGHRLLVIPYELLAALQKPSREYWKLDKRAAEILGRFGLTYWRDSEPGLNYWYFEGKYSQLSWKSL